MPSASTSSTEKSEYKSEDVLPVEVRDEAHLEELLSRPDRSVIDFAGSERGDLVVLGAGGKLGPSFCRLARRAWNAAGSPGRIIAVSRFSSPGVRAHLDAAGIETVVCDLFDPSAIRRLPSAPLVVFMVGVKFGTSGQASGTWAANTYLPGVVADRYRDSRIAVLSTGNVYPFSRVDGHPPRENTAPAPVGEYAQSCLGRERVFEFFSRRYGTPCTLVRLNYAVELRYGVLLDIARKVAAGAPIDLSTGYVNVIWQGDANRQILRSLELAASPPSVLNVTGPEVLSVRDVACRFGRLLDRKPVFVNHEAGTALLSDASRAVELFGRPSVHVDTLIEWVARWVARGGRTFGKPTHFEVRDGRF
ncbi:MAG: NAD(P)-dependent oxidoreductase [Kiritimatiellaeota bacterium]|nr:NAD(P)-dependent oxidoreductase [Kiritimatiellota bacterium]